MTDTIKPNELLEPITHTLYIPIGAYGNQIKCLTTEGAQALIMQLLIKGHIVKFNLDTLVVSWGS